eukprot:2383555-Prymnesium_polylepis.1
MVAVKVAVRDRDGPSKPAYHRSHILRLDTHRLAAHRRRTVPYCSAGSAATPRPTSTPRTS